MSFTATITGSTFFGNKRISWGTYVNSGGSTGGAITVGEGTTEFFDVQPSGASVATSQSVVNATLPTSGQITIVTNANESGQWFGIGT